MRCEELTSVRTEGMVCESQSSWTTSGSSSSDLNMPGWLPRMAFCHLSISFKAVQLLSSTNGLRSVWRGDCNTNKMVLSLSIVDTYVSSIFRWRILVELFDRLFDRFFTRTFQTCHFFAMLKEHEGRHGLDRILRCFTLEKRFLNFERRNVGKIEQLRCTSPRRLWERQRWNIDYSIARCMGRCFCKDHTWTEERVRDVTLKRTSGGVQTNQVAKKSTITSLSPAVVSSPLRQSLEISRTGMDDRLREGLKSREINGELFFSRVFIAGEE